MVQATLPVEAVTRSTEWNYLLEQLQAHVDELTEALTLQQQALASNIDFSYEGLANEKAAAMHMKVQIDTLQAVIAFPQQIMETGAQAKLELATYDND